MTHLLLDRHHTERPTDTKESVDCRVIHFHPLGHVRNVCLDRGENTWRVCRYYLAGPVVDQLEEHGGGRGGRLEDTTSEHTGVLVSGAFLDPDVASGVGELLRTGKS